MVVTVRSLSDASTTRLTLDANGQVVEAVDQNGVTSRVDYNRSGQPLRVRRAVGTPHERTTHYYYNAQGDLQAFDPPAGPTSRVSFEYCRYDMWFPGAPPQKAQPEVYVGQVTRIHYPDGTSEYFGYNDGDEPAWHVGQDGRAVTLDRDALHRVYRVNYPDTPGFAGFSVETEFDHFGRVKQVQDGLGLSTCTYDDLNRPVTVTPAAGQGASFQYLQDSVLKRRGTRVTVPGVGAWEYRGDGKGRTAQVLNPFGQLTSWSFDPAGRLLRESRSNGTWTDYSYNTRDWLTQMEHRLADGSLLDRFQYLYTDANGVYDPTGHLRREVDAGGRTHAFAYNELYELIGESHPDWGARTFSYDPNGNRRSQSVAGAFTEWYGYDVQNKLLWSNQAVDAAPTPGQSQPFRTFSYDANGQPLASTVRDAAGLTQRSYAWDGMRKLRSLTATGALPETFAAEYDGGGLRARSTHNGVTTTYSLGLLEEVAGGGSTVYTPGVSQRQNGVDRFFHSDWLGSTRYLTDGTGLSAPTAYRFDGYGNVSASAGPDATHRKFAGGHGYQSDALMGLQLLGQRYYDPAVGRFLNPDPIGFAGGLNLYAYCENDPIQFVDPDGLQAFSPYESELPEVHATTYVGLSRQHAGLFRSLFGLIDPGPGDGSEALSGRELFTGNKLSIPERIVSGIAALIPCASGSHIRTGWSMLVKRSSFRSSKSLDDGLDGSFSIINWNGYPPNVPKPSGPLRILEGEEYEAARKAADAANRKMHSANPELDGLDIHEIKPVKFGGSPTDPSNKIVLDRSQHSPITTFWNRLRRYVTGK